MSRLPLPTRRATVAPSLLAADSGKLAQELRKLERSADWVHVDVMDGHFVPNLSFGPAIVADLSKTVSLPMDVHLMIEKPWKMIEPFAAAGANSLTVHVEACPRPRSVLKAIRAAGMKAGLSLKPKTPAKKVFPFLDDLDLILVMTVEPGFGGQAFMPSMARKVETLRKEIDRRGASTWLQVDGGINRKTAREAARWGADNFVAGSAIFKSADSRKETAAIRRIADQAFRSNWN